MTVESTVSKVSYSGDGSSTEFTVPFYFLADAHLFVYVDSTLKTINTHYTVTGAMDPDGGVVTFLTAPANATTVLIFRCPPITQLIDYIANDEFPAETHEMGLDKLTMICQCLSRLLSLTLHLPNWVAGVDTELPEPEAGYLIGWNATEDGLTNYDPALFGGAGAGEITSDEWMNLINAGTEGDLLVRGATTWELLPKGTDSQALMIVPASFGGTGNPEWSSVPSAPECWCIACSDETSAITASTSVPKRSFLTPYAFRIEEIKASLVTAQTSGSVFTVNIKVSGTTIFSTKLTFDNTEEGTFSATTPYVLTTDPTDLAENVRVDIYVDQIGDGTAEGLKVYIIGRFLLGV